MTCTKNGRTWRKHLFKARDIGSNLCRRCGLWTAARPSQVARRMKAAMNKRRWEVLERHANPFDAVMQRHMSAERQRQFIIDEPPRSESPTADEVQQRLDEKARQFWGPPVQP